MWEISAVVHVAKESSWRLQVPLLPYLLYSRQINDIWKIVAGKLNIFLEGKSLLPSQFLYLRALGTCDALLTVSHHLPVAIDRCMEEGLFNWASQFSAAFDRVSYRGLLYKLRSIGVGRQFLSIVSEFLSNRNQRVRSDDVVSTQCFCWCGFGVPQASVLARTVVVYILHPRALPHCWEPYCGLCGWYHDLCSHSYTVFASSSDGIVESRFDRNRLIVFEVAHEAQP